MVSVFWNFICDYDYLIGDMCNKTILCNRYGRSISAVFLLQLPVMVCLLLTTMIGDYIHREKFNIYYCKLENGIDIDYIKKNYCIEDINESCVLFVDKGNDHNFCVWELMQGYDSLYQAEIKMFL